jgi:hypothetical protein
MKSNFKPLGIAAAVAVASAGYANVASAQAPVVANNALGDLALVPYYTVADDWITGIHIVNTSDSTQVVKFRFRRASDSMDALDFNVVLSPQDVYAGTLRDEGGDIFWSADDSSCTVPALINNRQTMPPIFRDGADTGYVEIVAMGQPEAETMPIAVAAKHKAGVPLSCEAVRSNFFADGVSGTTKGVVSATETYQDGPGTDLDGTNLYVGSDNALKVSYFIRDNATGVEFGDNATHIQDFLAGAHITNQQFGFISGDLDGFDFPDLDGGVPTAAVPERGRFEELRNPGVLGVGNLINEWTANADNGATLDWVVTLPGQYTMLHLPGYYAALTLPAISCVRPSDPLGLDPVADAGTIGTQLAAWEAGDAAIPVICDYRDIPVTATVIPYNREEGSLESPEGDLVVSPALPGTRPRTTLDKEVNVVTFGGNSVLGVSDVDITADLGQPYGWLALSVSPQPDNGTCEWTADFDQDGGAIGPQDPAWILGAKTCEVGANETPPMIGFAAWQRSVAANPDASYGRIVAHSFTTSE